MILKKIKIISFLIITSFLLGNFNIQSISANNDTNNQEIINLKQEIENKQNNIKHINSKIDLYKKEIEKKRQTQTTLNGELDLLDNRIKKTNLDIKATQEEIDAINSEIKLSDLEIDKLQKQLDLDKQNIAQILQKIQVYDNNLDFQLLFSSNSFSDLFDHLQHLQNVNSNLDKTVKKSRLTQNKVKEKKITAEGKKKHLINLKQTLEKTKNLSKREQTAKETILLETQNSEANFNALMYSLKQEDAYINQEINNLHSKIEAKISQNKKKNNETANQSFSNFIWPVDPHFRGISAYFHDPTYPYRYLYEHPGVDLPEIVGTPVKAAASGYVAWTRTGRAYGNYIMVIHSNGLASLYAHLSRFDVSADQFVSQGQVLGLSGGAAGAPGSGLSTGPHLHFEIRKDGIPVNPLNYLTY